MPSGTHLTSTGGDRPGYRNRRTFLKAVGVSGVGVMTGVAGCLGGESENVLIGGVVPRSGPLSALGESEENGIRAAVDYLNEEEDGINGREVEVSFEDTATDPGTGRDGASRLVESENVDFLVGAVSGAVAASVAEYAATQDVPYWTYGGSRGITGADCRPTTFRYTTNTVQDARSAAPWALENLGTDVWIHFADYAYGQDIAADFEAEIDGAGMGANIVDITSTPIGETEFSTYLTEIDDEEPDWVLMGVTGADLIAFVQQATEFGLKDDIGFFSINVTTQDIRQAVGEAGIGVYGNIRYDQTFDADENDRLVEAYTAEYDQPPTDPAMVMWTSIRLHAQAAEAAGTLEPADVIGELEGFEAESPMGPTEIRACDHQAIRDIPIGVIAEPDEHEWPSIDTLDTIPGEDAIRTCAETGCDMQSL